MIPSILSTNVCSRLLLPVLALLLAAACTHEKDYSNPYMYTVTSNGSPVPGVGSNAAAVQLTGSYNALTNSFTYSVVWKKLSTAPVGGGIYPTGSIPIAGTEHITWQWPVAAPVTGQWHAYIVLDASLANKLLSDSLHFVIRTAQFPQGKFTGNLKAVLQYP